MTKTPDRPSKADGRNLRGSATRRVQKYSLRDTTGKVQKFTLSITDLASLFEGGVTSEKIVEWTRALRGFQAHDRSEEIDKWRSTEDFERLSDLYENLSNMHTRIAGLETSSDFPAFRGLDKIDSATICAFRGLQEKYLPDDLEVNLNPHKYSLLKEFFESQPTGYWIFVITDHADAGLTAGEIFKKRTSDQFWGLGERTAHRGDVKKGDRVIFTHPGGDAFLGTARLASDSYGVSEEENKRFTSANKYYLAPFGVKLSSIEIWDPPRRISNMTQKLSFVKRKQLGAAPYLQGGVRSISKGDFDTILQKVIPPSGSWDFDFNAVAKEILTEDEELAISVDRVVEAIMHLAAGKHVILVGPPGTGKTDIARRLARTLSERVTGSSSYVAQVASYEWGRYDVIGGNSYPSNVFHEGCVLDAIRQGQWLLIDEFNRADMNKAFGELFMAFDHGEIPLRNDEKPGWLADFVSSNSADSFIKGKPQGHCVPIQKSFKIIGTMNDYDKNILLTELSYGLLRRFAFVEIDILAEKELDVIRSRVVKERGTDSGWSEIEPILKQYLQFVSRVRQRRVIGPATTLDIARFLLQCRFANTDLWAGLGEALVSYVTPQLDRLDHSTLSLVHEASSEVFKDDDGAPRPQLKKFRDDLEVKLEQLNRTKQLLLGLEQEEKD